MSSLHSNCCSGTTACLMICCHVPHICGCMENCVLQRVLNAANGNREQPWESAQADVVRGESVMTPATP